MSETQNLQGFQGRALDTLAINGKAKKVFGTGMSVKTEEIRERKGKSKFLGRKLAIALGEVAKSESDEPFLKKCKRTYYCMNSVVYHNGAIHGNYCKNSFCLICTKNRKAELINKYYPILKEWQQPIFLTLTVRSVKVHELRAMVKAQKKAFGRIIDKYEKRAAKGTGKKLVGMRCHESNFNPIAKTYNPHFHIITPDRETAEILKKEWLAAWPKEAEHWCQKIRIIKDLNFHLKETIKYGTKIFTDPEMKKGLCNRKKYKIYVRAFYTVLKAFEGMHLLSTFGFKLNSSEKKESIEKTLSNPSELTYLPQHNDWVNLDTGSMLTRYNPDFWLIQIVNEMDKELS